MSIKAVLFDLDGTLLPMDQNVFIKTYYKYLAAYFAALGYEPKKFLDTVYKGVYKMLDNDGSKTNEQAFWDTFIEVYGQKAKEDEEHFEKFYNTDFQKVAEVCGKNENAAKIIKWLKEQGIAVVLATNPLFPTISTYSRIRWAGLEPSDFALVTTYENTRYSKPKLEYYNDILSQLDLKPEECIMVGNDVSDDMVVRKLKMKCFLLTDCLINSDSISLSLFKYGSFDKLEEFLKQNI